MGCHIIIIIMLKLMQNAPESIAMTSMSGNVSALRNLNTVVKYGLYLNVDTR